MQSVWHSGILKSWKPKTSRDSKGYDDYFFRTLFSLHVVLNDVCWEISINTESHNFHNLRIYFSITLKIMKLWVKSDGNTTYSIKTMMSLWVFFCPYFCWQDWLLEKGSHKNDNYYKTIFVMHYILLQSKSLLGWCQGICIASTFWTIELEQK